MNDRREGDGRGKGGFRGRDAGSGQRSGFKPRAGAGSDGGNRGEGDRKPFRPRPKAEGAAGDVRPPRKPFHADDDRRPRAAAAKTGERRAEARDDRARRAPAHAAEAGEPMRIAKRLARAGIASRRDAEGMIADGRVKLNGKLVETPAVTVTALDQIEVDNVALPATERTRLWLYHKPAGLVTTNRDPEGRPTVFDRLPDDLPRVLTVGRLDINTEGLLLLTNDGGLARVLELPATGWLRRYRVRAHGSIKQAQLDELRNGIAVDGVFYGAIEASLDTEKGSNVWMTLGLREGKNREVKRILSHLGLDVNRLIRISFGPFQLGDLPEGAVREIRGRTLREQLGERLIEDAGADFDAPIVTPFTNEVVEAERKPREEAAARPEPKAEANEWVSAKGETRPSRKAFGQAKRDSALSRLDTKPRREAPRRDRAEGDKRPKPFNRDEPARTVDRPARPKPGTRRSANVWMAPGARPLGEKRAAERDEREKRRASMPERSGEGATRREERGERPMRSHGFRDAPANRAPEGAEKPRRSAGFRNGAPGKSFGDRPQRAGRPGEATRPPRRDGDGAGGKPGPRGPRGGDKRPRS